jgi:tetratricopeptide (TPR) repeat protein
MKIRKIFLILTLGLLITANAFIQPAGGPNTKTGETKTNPKIQKLLKELKDSREGPERVSTLLELAKIYLDRDPGQALDYTNRALAISEKINDPKSISESIRYMGRYYHTVGNYSRGLEYCFKSLEISEDLGHRKEISSICNDIGTLYDSQGNYPLALEFYFKSLKIDEELGDINGITNCYNNIGLIYYAQGNYPLALEFYLKSLKIDEELGDRNGIATCFNNIGLIYHAQGNYPLALDYYFKSLKIKEELGDRNGIATRYINIGNLYKDRGNYPPALEYHFKGLKINEELGNKEGITYGYLGIGISYTRGNDKKKGLDYLTRAYKLAKTINQAEIVTQAAELVTKFLTISEGGWITKTKVTMAEILRDAMDSAPGLRDIPCTISLAEDLKPIDGDRRQLRQVMVNLLLNANEATTGMGKNKKICISAQNIILTDDNRWSLTGGEYVKVSVSDNGEGIPEDVVGKIFDPYFSTKERGVQKGMGMGLAVSYAIVQRHNGHLAVTSGLQEGATFDLYLPVTQCQKK